MKKPAANKRWKRKKHRPNPGFFGMTEGPHPKGLKLPDVLDGLPDRAADLMIGEALRGATTNEKLLVAALLPEFLRLTRLKPKPANENPNEAETNAGGKEE
jgi:hypothetical protein